MDKIVCFGKNYLAHMSELGDKPVERPVIFLKPPSVLKQCSKWNETLPLLLTGEETHYECEIAILLKHGGYRLSHEDAKSALGWYTVGLDMTLRQVQSDLKKASHPWTTGKVFPDSAVIGPWIEITDDNYLEETFTFTLDDSLRQKSQGKLMIFNPVDLIVYASHFFELCEGDILFTGTPAGVGRVHDQATGTLQIGDRQYSVIWRNS